MNFLFQIYLFNGEKLPKKSDTAPLWLFKVLKSNRLSKETKPRRHQHHRLSMTWVDKGNPEQRLRDFWTKSEYILRQASSIWVWLGCCFQLRFGKIAFMWFVWVSMSNTKDSEHFNHQLWWVFSALVLQASLPVSYFLYVTNTQNGTFPSLAPWLAARKCCSLVRQKDHMVIQQLCLLQNISMN